MVFILLIPTLCKAQYPLDIKSDYNWILGYSSGAAGGAVWGISHLSFNGISFDTIYNGNQLDLTIHETNTSQSDIDGNLLYYFDGYHVVGANHQLLPNGDSLNCCEADFMNFYPYGQTVIQGAISFSFNQELELDNHVHYLLHKTYTSNINGYVVSYNLRTTRIDISNSQPYCSLKDTVILYDTLAPGYLSACRHANGRDWWVIQQRLNKKKYFSFLLTPKGLELKQVINKGGYVKQKLGQVMFTPDGTKYIESGISDFVNTYHINIFDFDRCTGLLSNPQLITFVDSSGSVSSSAAVSANSRYLYVASRFKIWQFDLHATDILASKTVVAEIDTFYQQIGTINWGMSFVWMQLGPDNKIYICAGIPSYLHTIDNPDESGLACSVNQHSFRLPSLNAYSMPNFPNYRLGPIDGSPCDTLGIDNIVNINDKLDNNTEPVKLYPNPASDYITLFVPRLTKAWEFALYDITGKEVFKNQSRGAFRSYNINHLAQGMYLWKLVYEDGKVENGKMVKQ